MSSQASSHASPTFNVQVDETQPPIPLDPLSLGAYIHSQRVKQLDTRIAEEANVLLEAYNSDGMSFINIAHSLGLHTVAQLDDAVKSLGQIAIRLSHYMRFEGKVQKGFSLFVILEVMLARSNCTKQMPPASMWEAEMMKAYEQITKYWQT